MSTAAYRRVPSSMRGRSRFHRATAHAGQVFSSQGDTPSYLFEWDEVLALTDHPIERNTRGEAEPGGRSICAPSSLSSWGTSPVSSREGSEVCHERWRGIPICTGTVGGQTNSAQKDSAATPFGQSTAPGFRMSTETRELIGVLLGLVPWLIFVGAVVWSFADELRDHLWLRTPREDPQKPKAEKCTSDGVLSGGRRP